MGGIYKMLLHGNKVIFIKHMFFSFPFKASHMDNVTQYTTKLLENFYNFASSFAINQSQMTPQPNVSFIPSTVLDQWYQSFKRKLQQDPNFWKR